MIRKILPLLAALALIVSRAAFAESGWSLLNMTPGVTDISRQIYGLHMYVFYICCAIGVVVFGAMIYSIVTFRHSKGAVPDTTMVHNTKVEVVWTIIPVVILIAMAIPAGRTLIQIEDLSNSELTIKGDRLSMGLELRVRREWRQLLLAARPLER